ncbi:MAG TPA: PhoH family protein, partial [Micromonosporaceae bacterium]|nr:PhoH family protein [Micromonosporaceae bacterium]
MTDSPPPGAPARVTTKITVPDPQLMVNLLGAGDELLRLVERAVASDIHVRGNEITITGSPADNALSARIFTELLELIEKGETLTADSVRRTVGMIEQGSEERPAE